jgi:hypothetical protein
MTSAVVKLRVPNKNDPIKMTNAITFMAPSLSKEQSFENQQNETSRFPDPSFDNYQ